MLRLGSLAGVDVLVSTSWFLVAAMIALLVAPRVEQVEPGIGAGKYLVGLVFAVLLYGAILLHEGAHALMAKRYGYGVRSITLHFLGGATEMDGNARSPRHEFWIAVVGPLTSIAVGLAALGLWFVTPGGVVQVAVEGLAGANLLIGVLNLVPGLPLDGGRVFKSVVWRLTGDQHRGTLAAGWAGRLIAIVVISWPVVQFLVWSRPPTIFQTLMLLVLGVFLWFGSTAAMTQARLRRRLPTLRARTLARRCVTVPQDLPLSEAVRRAQEAHAGGIVTLDQQGAPVGIVSESAVLAAPVERHPWMATSAVARSLEAGLDLGADLAGEDLVRAITSRPAEEYLLLEPDGSIYGILSTVDVDRAFREAAR
jgi:Zn-dependent protease